MPMWPPPVAQVPLVTCPRLSVGNTLPQTLSYPNSESKAHLVSGYKCTCRVLTHTQSSLLDPPLRPSRLSSAANCATRGVCACREPEKEHDLIRDRTCVPRSAEAHIPRRRRRLSCIADAAYHVGRHLLGFVDAGASVSESKALTSVLAVHLLVTCDSRPLLVAQVVQVGAPPNVAHIA